MKELVFIQCVPTDLQFQWQTDVQLHNFKKFGYDKLAHVLVYIKYSERTLPIAEGWKELIAKYPDTQFHFYTDEENLERILGAFQYVPLLRPWLLKKHFALYPALKNKAVFYHDADVIFTKYLDFTPFLNDEVCYLSDTSTYLNYTYFESKIEQVRDEKKELYKQADPLGEFVRMFEITKDTLKDNDNKTGGAQSLLKNVDSKFWSDVFDGCLFIKTGMHNYNQKYFKGKDRMEKENNGFQAWCADMWSLLWNLWKRKIETATPKELDFAWASDPLSRWDEVYIFHNAGAGRGDNLFNKSAPDYVNNKKTPIMDDLSWVDSNFCSINYVRELKELNNK